jgi:hypothetical protein
MLRLEFNQTAVMIGSIEITTRPLKMAFLVDSNSGTQIRDAIRLASTLWGGSYLPIIPLHKRMPATWRDKPLNAPSRRTRKPHGASRLCRWAWT